MCSIDRGIFFLGHDAAAAGISIGKAYIVKFCCGPEVQILGKARQGGSQGGKISGKLQKIIPGGHRVQRVGYNAVKAQKLGGVFTVDGKGSSSHGAGSKGGTVQVLVSRQQPVHIPHQGFCYSQGNNGPGL